MILEIPGLISVDLSIVPKCAGSGQSVS